jgi:hypothetical protein
MGGEQFDTIEWAAVRRGNGFVSARAVTSWRGWRVGDVRALGMHGLRPEWNGAGCYHAIKFLCLATPLRTDRLQ